MKKPIKKLYLIACLMAIFGLGGCGFHVAHPNQTRFLFNSKTLFIKDFANDTFVSEVEEISRLSLISKIQETRGLFLSNHLETESILLVTIKTAGYSSTETNSKNGFHFFRYTITASVNLKTNPETGIQSRSHKTSVSGIADYEKNSSTLDGREIRLMKIAAAENLTEEIFKAITIKF